jgi:hypothetical protein
VTFGRALQARFKELRARQGSLVILASSWEVAGCLIALPSSAQLSEDAGTHEFLLLNRVTKSDKALIGHECQRAEAEIRAPAKVRGWESWKILVSATAYQSFGGESGGVKHLHDAPPSPRHAVTNFRP